MFVLFSFPFRIAKNASRYMYTIYHHIILVIMVKFIARVPSRTLQRNNYCLYGILDIDSEYFSISNK